MGRGVSFRRQNRAQGREITVGRSFDGWRFTQRGGVWISGSKMEVAWRELRGKTRESRAEVAAA